MKVMVVGGGGSEHAIIKKIKENKNVEKIYALPGNGGIAADAECVDIGAKDIEKITVFAKENGIDYAIVAPDDPLVLGAVDSLQAAGIPCFGPEAKAAVIEGSKIFSKNLMKKIKKELRKRVDKIILDELFQNVKFEEVTEGEKRYYKAKIKQTDRKYVSAVLQQLFYTEEFQKRLEALGEETKKDVTSKFQQEYIDKAISNAKFYYRMN